MAVIFSSTFNTGTFVDWDDVDPLATLIQRGCGRTYCLGCVNPQVGTACAKAVPLMTAGAIRVQYAATLLSQGTTSMVAGFTNPVGISAPFQFQSGVGNDGSISLYTPLTSVVALAPAGSVTLDGTWHGIQILFTITAGTHMGNPANFGAFTAIVNNVVVGTLSGVLLSLKVGGLAQPTGITGFGVGVSSSIGALTKALDNVELDDVAAAVSWLPCAADPITTCAEPTWATVTGLAVVCPLTQLVISGSGFLDGADITVTSPTGDAVPFTLVSLNANQIVLQLTAPFVNGAYCVTVENP